MESKVNPNDIQDRADKLATADAEVAAKAAADKAAAEKPVEAPKAPEAPKVIEKALETPKPVEKAPDAPKMPNDPIELRKWATKASQESAALREDIKRMEAALAKLTKKPVDYKELAKNPDAIQKQIEIERQEAIAEMQKALDEKTFEAAKNATVVARIEMEHDTKGHPDFERLFPLMQNLSANQDGRINFNKADVKEVLEDLYQLASQLAPIPQAPVAPAPVAPVEPPAPVGKSQEEVDALLAAAEKRGYEKAQDDARKEASGQGIGSRGQGGKRSSGVSKEALNDMPLNDLKKLIQQ